MTQKYKLKFGQVPVEPIFWYLEAPLYHCEDYRFDGFNQLLGGFEEFRENLINVIFPHITIDVFCRDCGRETVFTPFERKVDWFSDDGKREMVPNGIQYSRFKCSRGNCNSDLYFVFEMYNGELTKVGQYPSIADLVKPELQKYRDVLTKEQLANWQRAVGLRAHGVGAGSYVYLRRIIEDLIEEARKSAGDAINSETYKKSRWPERIKLLAGHLPRYLVDNAAVYGVLSKGVHELSEEVCANYFDVMHTAMELICDDKLAIIDQKKKADAGSKALQQVLSSLGKAEAKTDKPESTE